MATRHTGPVHQSGPVLQTDWSELRTEGQHPYEVVIIGSGYGGAIPARRLSAIPELHSDYKGKAFVCLLERGREWPIGSYPDTLGDAAKQVYRPETNPLGLYQIDSSEDVSVMHASGLGGTSLINFNAAIVPDKEVFEAGWPEQIKEDAGEGNGKLYHHYYEKAKYELDVQTSKDVKNGLRYQVFTKRAAALGLEVNPLEITVNYKEEDDKDLKQPPVEGLRRRPCINCGDCGTGCNVGAKNTLYLTYLPHAKASGAHIFTQTEVDYIEKADRGIWLVHAVHRTQNEKGEVTQEEVRIPARRVIVAAGTLGTNGIMLRSKKKAEEVAKAKKQKSRLPLSPCLGTGFHDNGDFFGFCYNGDDKTDVVGWGGNRLDDKNEPLAGTFVGPGILSQLRYPDPKENTESNLQDRYQFQDMCFPRSYRELLAFMFQTVKEAVDTDKGDTVDQANELVRRVRDLSGVPKKTSDGEVLLHALTADGALNHSMFYLCMAHRPLDKKRLGRIVLDPADGKTPKVVWPTPGEDSIFEEMNKEVLWHAQAQGATFLPMSMWQFSPYKALITAHPLGGCSMADNSAHGVINDRGEVFTGNPNDPTETHTGLYITDGSTIPRTLGANPLLTLTALAERFSDLLKEKILSERAKEENRHRHDAPQPNYS